MSTIDATNEAQIFAKIALSVLVSGWTAVILSDPMIGSVVLLIMLAGVSIYHYRDIRELIRKWQLR